MSIIISHSALCQSSVLSLLFWGSNTPSDQYFPVFFRENPCTGIFYTVLGPLPQNYNFVQHLRLLKYFTRPKSTRIVVLGSFFCWSYRDQLAKKANLTKLKSMVGGTTKKMWVHFHKASHIFLISNFLS